MQSEGFACRGDRVAHVDELWTIKGRRSCRSRSTRSISTSMVSSPTQCTASLSLTSNGSVWPRLQTGFDACQGEFAPLFELGDRDANFARHRVNQFAAQQAQDDSAFAPETDQGLNSGGAGGVYGRATRALRRRQRNSSCTSPSSTSQTPVWMRFTPSLCLEKPKPPQLLSAVTPRNRRPTTTMAKRTQEAQSSQPAETAIKGPCGLDELIRQGARQVIHQAIKAEWAALLEQYSNVKTLDGRRAIMRNGYLPERETVTAIGPVPVQVPKVRDRSGSGAKFNSNMVPPYVRKSPRASAALPWLYLRGVSTGDMSEAFSVLLGEQAKALAERRGAAEGAVGARI
ncbi:MAG: transposase [Burkholderia sp.]